MDTNGELRWTRATAGVLGLFARPLREARERGGVAPKTNRGYGSREKIFFIGRVFRQSSPDPGIEMDGFDWRERWDITLVNCRRFRGI